MITAAEHTMALLLALARNIPRAHASLTGGAWERSKFSGVELHGKVLGILGFGRIGQLVAQRARGFGMRVVAFDPYVSAERYRELGVDRAPSIDDVYGPADFLTLHLPKTAETEGILDAAALQKCRDGVRILNVARGSLIVEDDLKAALDGGKVAGAALDVFRSEPVTEHPLFGYPNVIVTPHLGASTAEATDRAGFQAAEQVVAALTGEWSQARSTCRRWRPRTQSFWDRLSRCAAHSARSRRRSPRAPPSTGSRPSSWDESPSATRGCSPSRSYSVCSPATPRRTSGWSTRPRLRRTAASSSPRSSARPCATTPISCA